MESLIYGLLFITITFAAIVIILMTMGVMKNDVDL